MPDGPPRADENVELVRQGFEAMCTGDPEALMPFIHPEFEATTPPALAASVYATVDEAVAAARSAGDD